MQGLTAYLQKVPCPKGTRPSHTDIAGSAGGAGGSFDVPHPAYQQFLDLYIAALEEGGLPGLTEQPCLYFPVIADIDMEYALEDIEMDEHGNPRRMHSDDFLYDVAAAFAEVVVQMSATAQSAHSIEVIVLQRGGPYVSGESVRDGIHLMLPHCILPRPAQAVVRTRVLKRLETAFDRLPGQKKPLEQAVDACYSQGTNWQMYGSRKPGKEPYRVSRFLRIVVNQGECVSRKALPCEAWDDWRRWVPTLSVRRCGPDDAWRLNAESSGEMDAVEEAWSQACFSRLTTSGGLTVRDSQSEDTALGRGEETPKEEIARAAQLVKCLSQDRAEDYRKWRDVGFALRNTSKELVQAWHEFSARSEKYDRRLCQLFWDKLRPESRDGPKLTIRSLAMWAREDSPSEAQVVEEDSTEQLLMAAIDGNTHTDWGRYVCALLPDRLASVRANGSGRGDRTLYVFEGHKWRAEPCGTSIKLLLKGRIVADVVEAASKHPDDAELQKRACKAINSLKTKGFRENVLGDITENVGDDFLLDKLDSKRHLVGWENGVYDLEAQVFRRGEPEDYITMSTGHEYHPPEAQRWNRTAREVQTFLEQVHVCPVLRKYCLDSLSVMLSGVISFEHMHCWTGTGSNGKSKTIKLLDVGLGDYLKTLPPSLLTGVRPESGKPTPELCSAAGARIVVMSEVDGKATINVAVMKELSGGDKIAVRALYGGSSTIKPQFSMIMTCNDLSKVDSNDDGTWRRLKVLPYKSKFTLNDPESEMEFKADTSLDARIENWAPYFVSMLQSRYPSALESMRQEPAEITEQVRQYRTASDRDADFMKQNLVKASAHEDDDDDDAEDADAWVLLDMYKREGRDRDITLSKLTEKLQRFGVPAPITNDVTGAATIPGYRIVLRSRT